ncbi:virulence RhuM family protein [bacterium]|nr:virulence RhuM family protein [bacterium]
MTDQHPSTVPVPSEPQGDFLFYRSEDGRTRVQVRIEGETVWLTQRLMAELYDKSVKTVNEHILNILEEGELTADRTIRKIRIVQTEGTREVERNVDFYSLEMILAVGYRVRSRRGTQFRQWATATLNEYLVKGFAMDDERLKDVRNLGRDYFDELLERIRDIRASERRFYQKITDIYTTSIDYDPKAEETRAFFATVQNKLHWAIHGHTAAELISERAQADQPNMGLQTWKNAPAGPIRRQDVTVAKNYLSEPEVRALNRIVTQYLDFAEDMAERRRSMTMEQWRDRLDAFLTLNEREILKDAGRMSHELAQQHAKDQFVKYDAARRQLETEQPTSDFDRFVEETQRLNAGKNDR